MLSDGFFVTFLKSENVNIAKNGDIWKFNGDVKILKLKISIFRGLRAVFLREKTDIIFLILHEIRSKAEIIFDTDNKQEVASSQYSDCKTIPEVSSR